MSDSGVVAAPGPSVWRRLPWILAIALLPVLFAGFRLRPVDDAFISLRYAQSWAEHHHHGWNPDDHVEGYTNFLWTALLALGWSRDHILAILRGLGMVSFLAALVLMDRFVCAAVGPRAAWLATILLAGNWSVVAPVGFGLETPLVLALLAWLLSASGRALEGQASAEWEASLAAALGILTRLDFVLLAAPLLAVVLWRRRTVRSAVALAVPLLLVVGSWLVWKFATYHTLLPATAAAKLSAPGGMRYTRWLQGISYLIAYLLLYGVGALALFGLRKPSLRRDLVVGMLGAAAAWSLYIVLAGGDWIEFRLAAPLAFLLVPLGAAALAAEDRKWSGAAVAASVAVSAWLALEFGVAISLSFGQDRRAMQRDSLLWSEIGRGLHRAFPAGMWGGSTVRIATTAAGAVPYYAELWTFDLVGLNTPEVSRAGVPHLSMPGHARHATVAQTEAAGVHLVLGRPEAVERDHWADETARQCHVAPRYFRAGGEGHETDRIRVVGVPLDGGRVAPMWYLRPSGEVDAALASGTLIALPCP
ncbi:MAG TPA: hypothetical protein VGQ33_08100 [Vicinamibacteria bacterium]|nr:hypothetical protein [Vicinamibacteria bacterium]